MDTCDYHANHSKSMRALMSGQIFNEMFVSVNESTLSSLVSSDPTRVCFCQEDNKPNCSLLHVSIEVFSGEKFGLLLVAVGQRNETVPAVILAHSDPPSNQSVQTTGGKCSMVYYTLSTAVSPISLVLYPENICTCKDHIHVVNVSAYILNHVHLVLRNIGTQTHVHVKLLWKNLGFSVTSLHKVFLMYMECGLVSANHNSTQPNQQKHQFSYSTIHTAHSITAAIRISTSPATPQTSSAEIIGRVSSVEHVQQATASIWEDHNVPNAHTTTFSSSSYLLWQVLP